MLRGRQSSYNCTTFPSIGAHQSHTFGEQIRCVSKYLCSCLLGQGNATLFNSRLDHCWILPPPPPGAKGTYSAVQPTKPTIYSMFDCILFLLLVGILQVHSFRSICSQTHSWRSQRLFMSTSQRKATIDASTLWRIQINLEKPGNKAVEAVARVRFIEEKGWFHIDLLGFLSSDDSSPQLHGHRHHHSLRFLFYPSHDYWMGKTIAYRIRTTSR